MKITTMLNALVIVGRMQGMGSMKRHRQYHAFRDGIHRRWIRMEQEIATQDMELSYRDSELMEIHYGDGNHGDI